MSDATSINATLDRRRWLILGVIGIAQLIKLGGSYGQLGIACAQWADRVLELQ
jgi:hypothetical protein